MVSLPSLVDYSDAVSHPATAFLDAELAEGSVVLSSLGSPVVASGGYAATFQLVTRRQRRLAIRCFHKHAPDIVERYAAIATFVAEQPAAFLVPVRCRHDGIRVLGQTHPLVAMDWVDADRLDVWLEDHVTDARAVDTVRRSLQEAVGHLRARGCAHGDLQHGNILVTASQGVVLVDYDGMFLPSLADRPSSEAGHRNYQHPERGDRYDATLDVFPAAVIDLCLRAVSLRPELFDRFCSGENILLDASDLADPASSSVFAELLGLPEIADAARRLAIAATQDHDAAVAVLDGTNRRALPAPAPRQATRTLPAQALDACDEGALRTRLGSEITVVGQVVSVVERRDRRDRPYCFINFPRRAMSLLCFPRQYAEWTAREDPSDLQRSWVRVTGLLQEHNGRLVMHLDRLGQVHRIDAERARALLAPAVVAPPSSTFAEDLTSWITGSTVVDADTRHAHTASNGGDLLAELERGFGGP